MLEAVICGHASGRSRCAKGAKHVRYELLERGGDRRVQGETMLDLEIQNIQLYARPLSKRTPAFESHARIQDAVYTRIRV